MSYTVAATPEAEQLSDRVDLVALIRQHGVINASTRLSASAARTSLRSVYT